MRGFTHPNNNSSWTPIRLRLEWNTHTYTQKNDVCGIVMETQDGNELISRRNMGEKCGKKKKLLAERFPRNLPQHNSRGYINTRSFLSTLKSFTHRYSFVSFGSVIVAFAHPVPQYVAYIVLPHALSRPTAVARVICLCGVSEVLRHFLLV
jgi:hypothetical protein